MRRSTGGRVGPALVWEIPREKFAQFASHRPYVLTEIVALLAAEIADAHDKMFSLGRRAAEEKLIVFLTCWRDRLARPGRGGGSLPVPMSRRGIGEPLRLALF